MQTTLESTGGLERRLNVAVPLAQIETEVEKRLARLARNVKVPGFRPGCRLLVFPMPARDDRASAALQLVFSSGRGGIAALASSRPALVVGMPAQLLQEMNCGGTGHDEHGSEGDVLQGHRHAFVRGVPGHSLGVCAEVVDKVGRG